MSLFSLTGKTALVAGASRGIGLAIAQQLAEAGARTVMAARSIDKLREHVLALEARGFEASALHLDMADSDSIRAAAEHIGTPDILVNVAGTNIRKSFPQYTQADYDHIMNLWRIGDNMAQAAALMTDTTYTSRLLGSAWPGHFNVPVAEDMYENIQRVGLPQWSADDQTLAKALQKELKVPERGLAAKIPELKKPKAVPDADDDDGLGSIGPTGGGSDDIGDISWAVPTVTLNYPSNIPGGPGHNWANGVSMATPIAHKGVVAGAKVQAMTMLDLLLHPELVQKAWDYYNNVQTKDIKYKSFLRPDDKPAIWLNQKTMDEFRPRMKALYYDPSKYDNYLEQLGIKYPTVAK